MLWIVSLLSLFFHFISDLIQVQAENAGEWKPSTIHICGTSRSQSTEEQNVSGYFNYRIRERKSQCARFLETKQGSISDSVLRVLPVTMTVSGVVM